MLRVLVAEDGRFTVRTIERAVEQLGHVCETAHDGVEAWAKIQHGGYQVLISDWDMPRMDGLQLCREVRGSGLDAYTYIIILTAHDQATDKAAALDAGADDFLTKPLQIVELAARLRVAERILSWENQLRAVNEALLIGTRELARVTQEIENLRARAELEATYDALTGVLNRGAWFKRLETEPHGSLAIFDIDHFKGINDTYGHPAGDHVLSVVCNLIADAIGECGVVGRVGGEEFGAFFRTSAAEASASCEAALNAVRTARLHIGGERVRVTVSVGLVDTTEELHRGYAAADRALYQAKLSGRDRLVRSTDPSEVAA